MSLEIKEGTAPEGINEEITTPGEVDPSQAAPSTDPSAEAGSGEVDPAAVAPPAYTPNLKFKVMDKEHEFAPYLKDVIKDEKTEKEIREIYEKAYGLDIVKPKFQGLRTEHEELRTAHSDLVGNVEELRGMYTRGDLDGFFGKLKVPFDKLLHYVAEKLQYQELPPEQQRQLDAQKQREREAYESSQRAQSTEQAAQEQIGHAMATMLDFTLDRADVKSFAEQYQAKTGKSFRDAVINYGKAAYYSEQRNLSPQQVVEEMMGHYGKFAPAAPAATTPQQQATPVAAAPKTPVIPNVSGRSTSPTGSTKPKSIEDLKKLHAQMIS